MSHFVTLVKMSSLLLSLFKTSSTIDSLFAAAVVPEYASSQRLSCLVRGTDRCSTRFTSLQDKVTKINRRKSVLTSLRSVSLCVSRHTLSPPHWRHDVLPSKVGWAGITKREKRSSFSARARFHVREKTKSQYIRMKRLSLRTHTQTSARSLPAFFQNTSKEEERGISRSSALTR